MHMLQDWATETKMSISSKKSKLLILKGNVNARPPVIKYTNIRIGKVDAATYLGVELETGLTFLPHVKKQSAKARNLFGKICRLIKVKFGASTVNLSFLYKTVFLAIMTYKAKAWHHSFAHWAIAENLKETQCQVLINTMGAYKTSPLQALCVISNNPPISLKLV